jgi:DNA (cytosine-5)-methyltransferase 1
MTHGSLFSGIGGFDLAAEWMGWENVFHCEWNEFGKKVLNYYWPKAISYHDITKTDFTIHRGKIDILTGGFPCQPYSSAGKRKGKEDERHLWPSMLRAIREIQPRWVVGENVLGLVNWSGGLVFHEVQADLEAAGYEVWPYVLPAVSVNAPHRRDRVWFVAYANGNSTGTSGEGTSTTGSRSNINVQQGERGSKTELNNRPSSVSRDVADTASKRFCGDSSREQSQSSTFGTRNRMGKWDVADTDSRGLEGSVEVGRNCEYVIGENGTSSQTGDVADTGHTGLQGFTDKRENRREKSIRVANRRVNPTGLLCSNWQKFPTQSPICTGDDGLSSQLDGITFSKWRNESIKAAGNAIVPQVVYQIFKAIKQYETLPRMADQILSD